MIKDENIIPVIIKKMKAANNSGVRVGIIGGSDSEVATYASANEFGTNKAGRNKNVTIPERSFMRSSFDSKKIMNKVLKGLEGAINIDWKLKKQLNLIGSRMKAAIQKKITSNVPPALSPLTRKSDGSYGGRSLVDTGRMKNAIDYEVFT